MDWVRAKGTRDSHGVPTISLGQLVFCADTWRRTCGTSVDKESLAVRLTSRGGRRGQAVGCFLFLPATPGASSRDSRDSPAHFRETRLTGRGQVTTGHIPTLGPLCTWASLVPFPELGSSILVPFCQESLLPGTFPGVTSWLTGLATCLYQTESDYGECYC